MSIEIDHRIESFKKRRLVILHDDFVAPFRGVLVAPAQDIQADLVNEAISLSGGICFVAISIKRASEMMLAQMRRPQKNPRLTIDTPLSMSMCVSVEAREGVSTGISSADRATTIRVLGEDQPSPRKLIHPGHIFPIETRDGGVLVKNSLPEGAIDLVVAAGFSDAALSP